MLAARVGHMKACLQMCQPQIAERNMYMSQTGERVIVAPRDRPRQRLHSNLENAPWVGEKEDGSQSAEDENKTA